MIVTPEFPEHRLQDPRRQAEWRVYQEIAGLHAPQLDFGTWLQDVAHYGLQVKGGETATAGGEWRLHSANGPETIPSPIAQTFDAAIAIRDIIKAQLHRKVFIFPVLCFPDMAPDPLSIPAAPHGSSGGGSAFHRRCCLPAYQMWVLNLRRNALSGLQNGRRGPSRRFSVERGTGIAGKPGEIADLTLSSGRGPGRVSPQVSITSWKCAKNQVVVQRKCAQSSWR